MTEELIKFWHSIKSESDTYFIYTILITFILYQQLLSWLNEIGQGYERKNKRKA